MKCVLDSNIALKWVLAEPDSPNAKQLRDQFQKSIHELLAPDIFEVEIAHALYDCLYVALAEQEKCELVTADTKLLKKLQAQFPFIVALASLP